MFGNIISLSIHLHDMKLSTQEAFEKNIRTSAPDHFAKVYGAVIKDRFERIFFSDKLYHFFKHYKPEITREVIRVESGCPISVSGDLFSSGERFVVIDNIEKVKKSDYQSLVEQIEAEDENTTFLLLGESLFPDIYQALKSDLIVLDLTNEKPWEKKRRIVTELLKMATREKKKIEVAAVDLLVDSIGNDLARLKSELEKLFVFTDGKSQIEISDVRQMTMPTKEKSYWQIARDLIDGGSIERGRIKDLSDWLIFAGQVRNQLMNMIRISEMLERGENPMIEGMRPNELSHLIQKCKERSLGDFLELLDKLFEFELSAKEDGVKPDHMVDMLMIAFSKQVARR